MKSIFLTFFLLLFTCLAANTIKVPEEKSSIQDAINVSINGDTILVAPGTYYENINFNGKNILLTSYYLFENDENYILNTIINGSQPVQTEKASCVLIISGEDSTAILQGFTLTGGTGTKWTDEHGAGTYVEGGGILITLSSPTIKNNFIVRNEAIKVESGITSAGGGGIRVGDGSPKIINNVIEDNKGMYGGGIVLNYCSNAVVKNNIIAGNRVYQAVPGVSTFGGGGIWIYATLPENDLPNLIQNNTIVSNSSNDVGGGIRVWLTNATIMNNIIWNNIQDSELQVDVTSSTTVIEYNDVENEIAGPGNISLFPLIADSSFYLTDQSPCIDAGNPDIQFNDPENPDAPGDALWPSLGSVRNDLGAYGGPLSSIFPDFSSPKLYLNQPEYDLGLTQPGDTINAFVAVINSGSSPLVIDSCSIMIEKDNISIGNSFPLTIKPILKDNIILNWAPQINEILVDTLLIYHNDPFIPNPFKVGLTGNSYPSALLTFNTELFDYGDIDVSTLRVDTTLYLRNNGSAPDSAYISLTYERVSPDSALEYSPVALVIEPHDSVGISFSIFPPLIKRRGFDIYQPRLIVDSKFSIGTKHFEKVIKFHLVGSTGLENLNVKPAIFELSQNYPNPFNPVTTINYQLPEAVKVNLDIYNIIGQKIATLVSKNQTAGYYSVQWDASGYTSGVYFYRLQASAALSETDKNFYQIRKLILLK